MSIAARELPRTLAPRAIRDALGLSRERMARLLDVSAKTIERWEVAGAAPAGRHAREQLTKVEEIVRLGLVVYTPEGFVRFLKTPLRTFGGRTALQSIEQGEADLVIAALAADHEGLGS